MVWLFYSITNIHVTFFCIDGLEVMETQIQRWLKMISYYLLSIWMMRRFDTMTKGKVVILD